MMFGGPGVVGRSEVGNETKEIIETRLWKAFVLTLCKDELFTKKFIHLRPKNK